MDEGRWADCDTDLVTDASLRLALSYVFAGNGFVYQLREPPTGISVDIFFLELVTIMSAINHAASLPHPPQRLLIWTDSLDSVGAFNSLRVNNLIHNGPLLAVASLILRS